LIRNIHPITLYLIILKTTIKCISILKDNLPFSILHIIFPLTFIILSILCVLTLSISLVFYKLSFIDWSIWTDIFTNSIDLIITEVSLINVSIIELIHSCALFEIIYIITFIKISCIVSIHSMTMFLTILELSLINIFITIME